MNHTCVICGRPASDGKNTCVACRRFSEVPSPLDHMMSVRDVMREFNCSFREASDFINRFGRVVARRHVISQIQLRFLKLSGQAAEFFATRPRNKKKVSG